LRLKQIANAFFSPVSILCYTIVVVPADAFELSDELKTYTVVGLQGKHVNRGFCAECGSQVQSTVDEARVIRIVKAGTRLAALVSKPRVNLTRFHGVLAPNHRWRRLITPTKAPAAILPLLLGRIDKHNAKSARTPLKTSWHGLLRVLVKE
jgi:hypothetical protein